MRGTLKERSAAAFVRFANRVCDFLEKIPDDRLRSAMQMGIGIGFVLAIPVLYLTWAYFSHVVTAAVMSFAALALCEFVGVCIGFLIAYLLTRRYERVDAEVAFPEG